MTDFQHTMQRRDGGQMTISVKADAMTLAIAPPITANEKEAMSGLKSLAEALKRDVGGSNIQAKDGVASLTINTPNGRDNALAMVAVSSLETHDVLTKGESKKFETALHASEQAMAQPQKAEAAIKGHSDKGLSDKGLSEVQKAAAAIGNAMKNMVTSSEPALAVAAQSIPGKSEVREIG